MHMELQEAMNKKHILRPNKAGDTTLPDLKLYFKSIVIQIIWYQPKNRYKDQWNRLKCPVLNSGILCAVLSHSDVSNSL